MFTHTFVSAVPLVADGRGDAFLVTEAVQAFGDDPWLERLGPGTVFEGAVRPAPSKHSISLQHFQRWLAALTNPNEPSKKAKLRTLPVSADRRAANTPVQ